MISDLYRKRSVMERIAAVSMFDGLTKESDSAPVHDEVVLISAAMIHDIFEAALDMGWLDHLQVPEPELADRAEQDKWYQVAGRPVWAGNIRAVPEYRIDVKEGDQREAHADLAILDDRKKLLLLLEIKSKREAQSASGWLRQTQIYATCGTPCVLVIAHDLDTVVRTYLEWAKVKVIDLRKL